MLMTSLASCSRRIHRHKASHPFFEASLLLCKRRYIVQLGGLKRTYGLRLFNARLQLLHTWTKVVGPRPAVAPRNGVKQPPTVRLNRSAVRCECIKKPPA